MYELFGSYTGIIRFAQTRNFLFGRGVIDCNLV